MKRKKVSLEVSGYLDEILCSFNCAKRTMFGCPAYFVNSNMFAGVFEGHIFLRLSEEDRERIFVEYDEAAHFDPLGGSPMKEYINLPEQLLNQREMLHVWLEKGFSYAQSLPRKKLQ
jgi:TfoX/Sxy family transcriptional regulator of competence genes